MFSFTLHAHQREHVLDPQQVSKGRQVVQNESRSQETLLADQSQTLREVCRFILLSAFIFQEFHYELIPVVCLHQVISKLTLEFNVIKQELKSSHCQLEEMRAEKSMNHKQITDLLRDKQELRRMNESQCEELMKMNEKCSQLM